MSHDPTDIKASRRRYLLAAGGGLTLSLGARRAMSQATSDNVIRFGCPLPLTGALAPEALKQRRGIDLWAETVNRSGGITAGGRTYRVEIVAMDYQSNTARAVQAAEQLITQAKVHFLFGPMGSGATKAVSNVSERYKVPLVASSASSVQVYDQGYQYLFGLFTPNATLTNPLVQLVKAKAAQVRQIAIVARNDLFPLAIAQEMENSAKAGGLEVVFFEKYAINTMDHASALSRIRALAPQWIFATGYINDLVLIRKQMLDQRIDPPVVTMIAGPAYQEFTESVGRAAAENITTAAWWHPAVRYNGTDIFGSTQNYTAAFVARYGSEPDYAIAAASAAGVVFQKAIEAAENPDPQAVRKALADMDVITFFGPIKFGPDGQITSLEPPVLQLQDGRIVTVAPAAIAQSELRIGG